MSRLFCFGLGYSALAFARSVSALGWRMAGTCREEAKRGPLIGEGIDVTLFTGRAPLADAAATLAPTTHLLISIPPDQEGDPVLRTHAALIARLPRLLWVGYLSTTGVYGDHGGAWVDESSPRAPTSDRARHRVAAEDAWLDLHQRHGTPVHLFRLAGIYGPGRSALDAVRAGRAQRIAKPGQVFSRIHVEDIAQMLLASTARPNPGAAYNLADDAPAPPAEVIAHACQLLGVAPPPLIPFAAAALSPMARSFYADNKRVSNQRIKRELGVRLIHPSYREGLAALLAAGG
ncbi:MAG: SDR family oxidoreductase [Alphaproteobacteria bacterium]|nr:SDR family oxidoreductase [Alphaproteobacteria bacterium]